MKKRLSIILCLALIMCMIPVTSSYAVKSVKAKSVSVAPKAMTLAVGDVAQLNATKKPAKATSKLTWSSSNKNVAKVSSKGLVTAVSEGKATITVKTSNKKTAKCTVIVKKYVTETEIREAFKEEFKSTFASKDDVQTLISQNTYTKNEIDSKLSGISVPDAYTKKEIDSKFSRITAQDTYTKNEIDSKFKGIVIPDTYTKSEIDSKISGINIPDTYTKNEIDNKINSISGESGSICDCTSELSSNGKVDLHDGQKTAFSDHGKSFTITDVDITKSLYNDFVDNSDGTQTFYAFKYDVKIAGTTDSDTMFSEMQFTNKFGASFWCDFSCFGNPSYDRVSIADGKFSIDTIVYGNINASELIVTHMQTSDEFEGE